MKNITKLLLLCCLLSITCLLTAQTNPAITGWLQNTTNTGSYYVSGNSTAIDNAIEYNCQEVAYSATYAYITCTGIPSYPTGPFLDGNPSNASDQGNIYQMPLNPVQETGTLQATTGGNIGVFINGVTLFDYRDGVAWNSNTNALCGGPGNPNCPGGPLATQDWSRDAIPAEMDGFDCSKGHPANGNYHHHQNPSAFKWDLSVLSNICDLYDADALYTINTTEHSPLIGFAYDGFPIYGAYGYKNVDGTGGIERIKSGYQLRNITVRTHHADGTDVDDGPAVSTTYFLGYFRDDYEWIDQMQDDYLDEHNGRFCITPEYPNGTYAYFATVDANWNSAYPYVVGPNFYGEYANRRITSIPETTTVYTPPVCAADLILSGATASGTYQVSNLITSTGQVAATEEVTFKADEILLAADFCTVLGAEFLAEIDPCGTGLFEGENDTAQLTALYNPIADVIVVQFNGLLKTDLPVDLMNADGQLIEEVLLKQGSTIQYINTQTLYDGDYYLYIKGNLANLSLQKISIKR